MGGKGFEMMHTSSSSFWRWCLGKTTEGSLICCCWGTEEPKEEKKRKEKKTRFLSWKALRWFQKKKANVQSAPNCVSIRGGFNHADTLKCTHSPMCFLGRSFSAFYQRRSEISLGKQRMTHSCLFHVGFLAFIKNRNALQLE